MLDFSLRSSRLCVKQFLLASPPPGTENTRPFFNGYNIVEITLEQRKKAMDKATWWGVGVNLLLSVAKLIVGIIGNSTALLADGLHSLSDLISDGLVLFATHHSNADADEDHPYGHARYETLATIALGVMLIAVALGVGIDAISHLLDPEEILIPSTLALVVAAASIASKEALYQYTALIGRRVKSKLLMANAWHHRSDAVSSVVVFVGIAGAIWGWPILDSVAAIAVAVMIAKIGWDLSYSSIQELVDTALEPEILNNIRQKIKQVDGVLELHMLRTRRHGHNALVEVHLLVDGRISVSEGHQISEAVENELIQHFDEINDVTVHIDPEDDENTPNSCKHLPLRRQVMEQLQDCWRDIPQTEQIMETTLHYLDGKVEVEIVLPISLLKSLDTAARLGEKINQSSQQAECVRQVTVLYRA